MSENCAIWPLFPCRFFGCPASLAGTMNPVAPQPLRRFSFPALTAALAAAGLISTAQAVEVAGSLLVNVDATTAPVGPISSIANAGTLGGVFETRAAANNNPLVAQVGGNGTRGIKFDGSDFLQHADGVGGSLIPADATLVGPNPTCTIEAWVLNTDISQEETIVSWGRRADPAGSN